MQHAYDRLKHTALLKTEWLRWNLQMKAWRVEIIIFVKERYSQNFQYILFIRLAMTGHTIDLENSVSKNSPWTNNVPEQTNSASVLDADEDTLLWHWIGMKADYCRYHCDTQIHVTSDDYRNRTGLMSFKQEMLSSVSWANKSAKWA